MHKLSKTKKHTLYALRVKFRRHIKVTVCCEAMGPCPNTRKMKHTRYFECSKSKLSVMMAIKNIVTYSNAPVTKVVGCYIFSIFSDFVFKSRKYRLRSFLFMYFKFVTYTHSKGSFLSWLFFNWTFIISTTSSNIT